MRLYHFTDRKNLESIGEQGLVPQFGENTHPVASLGVPVVWLTCKPFPAWMIGLPDDLCMLTIEVKRNKHLHHWRTWMSRCEAVAIDETGKGYEVIGRDILANLDKYAEPGPLAADGWAVETDNHYIYTSTIRSRHIIECSNVEFVVKPSRSNPEASGSLLRACSTRHAPRIILGSMDARAWPVESRPSVHQGGSRRRRIPLDVGAIGSGAARSPRLRLVRSRMGRA